METTIAEEPAENVAVADEAQAGPSGVGQAASHNDIRDADVAIKLAEYLEDDSLSMDTTERQLRRRLEEHFGTSLKEKKQVIRREVLKWLAVKKRDERRTVWTEQHKLKAEKAEKKQKAEEDAAVAEWEAAPKAKRKPSAGYKNPVIVSEALQNFLPVEDLGRPQIVKLIWEYIKSNDLQNPEDRRYILLDDTLKTLFTAPLTCFSMNKQLSRHIFTNDRKKAVHETRKSREPKEEVEEEGEEEEEAKPKKRKSRKAPEGLPKKKQKLSAKRMTWDNSESHPFQRRLKLSEELHEIFGEEPLSRPKLTKKFFEYIRTHDLQDPENRQFVLSNAKLKKLTGQSRFRAFGIMAHLKPYILGYADEPDKADGDNENASNGEEDIIKEETTGKAQVDDDEKKASDKLREADDEDVTDGNKEPSNRPKDAPDLSGSEEKDEELSD